MNTLEARNHVSDVSKDNVLVTWKIRCQRSLYSLQATGIDCKIA